MPALSWNEIRQRAIRFSREWEGVTSERAEAQTFWNEFFQVFGIRRRTVASFEEPVKHLNKDSYHRIDLFEHVEPQIGNVRVLLRDGWRFVRLFAAIFEGVE